METTIEARSESKLVWTGPFRVRDLLAACLNEDQAWPPASRGVYLISREAWAGEPSQACYPLYFGGNTGESKRFCTRVGDLIADMHGFFDGGTGHHSGGQKLYAWCTENKVHPGALYIAWATREPWCDRCSETEVGALLAPSWDDRLPLLNAQRPTACSDRTHTPVRLL